MTPARATEIQTTGSFSPARIDLRPRLICTCGNDRWIKTHVMEYQKLGHVAWQCDKCGEIKHVRIPKPKGQVVYLEEEDD